MYQENIVVLEYSSVSGEYRSTGVQGWVNHKSLKLRRPKSKSPAFLGQRLNL